MTPNDKERMRIKDIFTHPWVIEFEKEEKERRVRQYSEKNAYETNIKLMSNVLDDAPKKEEVKAVKKEVRKPELEKKDERKKSAYDDKYDINANSSIYDKDESEDSLEIVKKKKKSSKTKDESQDKSNNDIFDDVLDLVKLKNTSIIYLIRKKEKERRNPSQTSQKSTR